jgi:hypothetical protein
VPGRAALSSRSARRPSGTAVRIGTAVAALCALAACGGSDQVHVAVPVPPAGVATACASFLKALPNDLVPQQSRRPTTPASPYTAAFGKPAVTVRCGIAVPKHDPTAFVDEVNNVDWLQLSAPDGAQRYVSYTSRLVVDIVIPRPYLPADVLLGIPQRLIGAPPARSDD